MRRLISNNVGLPRDVAWRAETVHTAIWERPLRGRNVARRLILKGDGQGISLADPLEPPATVNLLICCSTSSSDVRVDL